MSGSTRRAAVGSGLRAGGMIAAANAISAASVASALAKPGGGDVAGMLERLTRLEQRAAVVYSALVGEEGLLDEEVAAAAELFAAQEREHVDALRAALAEAGGEAPRPPEAEDVDGLAAIDTQEGALEFAVALENELIAAFNDSAENPADQGLLKTLAQISCNEAQHLAVLRQQLGDPPIPEAFETGRVPIV